MEEEKAAAYYDELTRKGEGAARFKRGLGFSSSSSSSAADLEPKPSSATNTTSFLGNFVRASSPGRVAEIQKQAQLESIQNKLKKKPAPRPQVSSYGGDEEADRRRRRRSRSRSRSRSRERYRGRRRSCSREIDRSPGRHHSRGRRRGDEDGERHSSRRRGRSRSRSGSEERERSRHNRRGHKQGDYSSRRARGSRSPASSPRLRHADRSRRDLNYEGNKKREMSSSTDYAQLIEGYSQMTAAERVKAKMKLQLSQTAAKDMAKGTITGWERFDFDKDAPLDDDDIEVAEDDELLVKDIGRSFRYSAVEAKREEEIKAAHDEAMFGVSTVSSILPEKEITEETGEKDEKTHVNEILISEKALAIQGSWRDRMRKPQPGQGN